MTGSASDTIGGAAKGAAIGAPLGPWGMALGGIGGGVYSYLTGGPSAADQAAAAANAQHLAQQKQNAIALENYRQAARDQYHTLLTNQAAQYQGPSNWLKAMTGSGMSTAGLSANENPLTLQQTGIGAPQGSDYTGYDTNSIAARGGSGKGPGSAIYHVGIGAQIGDPRSVDPDGASQVNGASSVGNDGERFTSVVDPNADVAAYLNPANNSNYSPSQATASLPPSSPSAGFSFAPRRPA